MIRVDFQHGDVGFGVASDHLRGEFALVSKRDFDVGGAVNYVIIRDDVAVGADDHAGTEALLFLLVAGLLPLRMRLLSPKN